MYQRSPPSLLGSQTFKLGTELNNHISRKSQPTGERSPAAAGKRVPSLKNLLCRCNSIRHQGTNHRRWEIEIDFILLLANRFGARQGKSPKALLLPEPEAPTLSFSPWLSLGLLQHERLRGARQSLSGSSPRFPLRLVPLWGLCKVTLSLLIPWGHLQPPWKENVLPLGRASYSSCISTLGEDTSSMAANNIC